jgi:hypothetical protein
MSAAGVRAGRAYVELGVDDRIQAGLRAAQARLRAFAVAVSAIGGAMAGVSGLVLTPLVAAAKSFADAGSAVFDATQRIGISAEAFSELSFVAAQSGASVEDLEIGFKKMQVTIADAANGSKTAAAALAAVGLSVADLVSLSPDQQLARIADGLSRLTNPAARTAAAIDILGKSGNKLVPMLAEGAQGLAAARAEAQRLGLTMSQVDAAGADALGDAIGVLTAQSKAFTNAIGAALAPALTEIAGVVSTVVGKTIAWMRENRELVVATAAVAAVVGVVGAALLAIGATIGAVSIAIGAVVGLVTTVVGALAAFSGVGFVIVGVLGTVAVGIVALIDMVPRLRQAFTSTFGDIAGIAKSALGSIVTFLTAGQFESAARVMVLGVKAVIARGLTEVVNVVIDGLAALSELLTSWSSSFIAVAPALAALQGQFNFGATLLKSSLTAELNKHAELADELRKQHEELLAQRKATAESDIFGGAGAPASRGRRFSNQAIVTFSPYAAGAQAPDIRLKLGMIGSTVAAMSRVIERIEKNTAKQQAPKFGA